MVKITFVSSFPVLISFFNYSFSVSENILKCLLVQKINFHLGNVSIKVYVKHSPQISSTKCKLNFSWKRKRSDYTDKKRYNVLQ